MEDPQPDTMNFKGFTWKDITLAECQLKNKTEKNCLAISAIVNDCSDEKESDIESNENRNNVSDDKSFDDRNSDGESDEDIPLARLIFVPEDVASSNIEVKDRKESQVPEAIAASEVKVEDGKSLKC